MFSLLLNSDCPEVPEETPTNCDFCSTVGGGRDELLLILTIEGALLLLSAGSFSLNLKNYKCLIVVSCPANLV